MPCILQAHARCIDPALSLPCLPRKAAYNSIASLVQLLENANEYIIHGYAYRDWIREIPDPHNNVAKLAPVGGVDLNRAMTVVYNEASISVT